VALVEAARFYNSFEAGLAKARLEADGVSAFLFDVEMSWEGMGLLIPIRLMVDESDASRARGILEGGESR
jgi:hypothetical protein